MKKRKLSAFIAVLLAFTFLFAMASPVASASNVTIEFLNPLGQIDMKDSLPLAERRPWALDENGRLTERIVLGLPTNGTQFPQIAIAMHLVDLYGRYGEFHPGAGIILVTSSIGGNWGPNTYASYDVYANSPDGLASGGLGGFTGNVVTFLTAPVGTLPSQGEWNVRYSSHPNLNDQNMPIGAVNWTGDIDVQLGGTAV